MYRKRNTGWLAHWDFILLDVCVLQLSFILAYCLRHGWANPYLLPDYRATGLVLLCVDLVYLFLMEPVRDVMIRGYWKEMESCVKSAALITAATTVYLFTVQGGQAYSRLVCLMTGGIYLIANYLTRLGWKTVIRRYDHVRQKDLMLVAAEWETARQVLEGLKTDNIGLARVAGVIALDEDASQVPDEVAGMPVVATMETMESYICGNWVDEVLVVQPKNQSNRERFRNLLDRIAATGVAVHTVIDFQGSDMGCQQMVQKVGEYTVLTTVIKSVTMSQAFFKRALDIAGGLVGCLLALIALAIVGPMIYAQSPGAIIFKQKRVGRNGKPFTMYKIRSMVLDAEARKQELMKQNRVSDGMMFKLDFDPRIIGARQLPDGTIKKGIGNVIRDWSIDELPQFWNVLKGDMSLVGTRPPTMDEWKKYGLQHRARMAFRPGITGLWQISGRSDITDFDQVVKLDMQYISQWSPGLDFQILLKTFRVVFKREGSM